MTEARTATIRASYQAYRARDRAAFAALLAPGFRFTSPYDDALDEELYFERCWPHSERFLEHVVERVVGDGDGAYVTYRARVAGGKEFRNTEYFTFDGALIASVTVFFGPSWRDGRFVPQEP
jgi:ketosteroid isomerase-like protein